MLLRSWGKYGVCHCTGYLFSSLNNDCPGAFVRKGANKRSSQFIRWKPSSLNYCVRTCTTVSLSLWTVYSIVATSGTLIAICLGLSICCIPALALFITPGQENNGRPDIKTKTIANIEAYLTFILLP